MKRLVLKVLGVSAAAVVLFPTAQLAAQEMTTPAAQATADSPEMMPLIATRSESAMRSDLNAARNLEDSSGIALREVERSLEIVRGRIEVRKEESETFKSRIDLAKKENNEMERAGLERERETIDQHVRLLERLRDVREAERRYQQSRREYARASVQFFEREMRLADMRTTDSLTGNVVLHADFMDQQGQVLRAQKTQADRRRTMAQRHGDLIDRRTRLLQAQVEWLSRQT